jgi:glycosyltransferase involved in cell wall biosynthesis
MRIGIDMLGGQDPHGQGRGVGRYVQQFVDALICRDAANEYVLYSFDRFAPWRGRDADRVTARVVPSGRGPLAGAVQALVDRNPDGLDLFLVTSPFSKVEGYRPPAPSGQRLRLASILYDLIPLLLDRDFYLGTDPADLDDYFERLARLRGYDLVLAISEATRADALRHLSLAARRVVNVSAATRDGFFAPSQSADLPAGLTALGLAKPFVFSVASADVHKNTDGLVRAFALLPPSVRATHQLVVAGVLAGNYVLKWQLTDLAQRHGVGDRLVLTGRLADERLREAYQHCAAFAFVSHYEGFGLPILEAMQCGAPVVAGDNSSQVEVVSGAGLLARAADDADVADKLGRVLTDAGLAASLRRLGPEYARRFSWRETVRRARAAFAALPPARDPRPLLACFVPPDPPEELRRRYAVHLYHEAGQVPDAALADGDCAAFDARLFERHDRVWNYQAVLHGPGDAGQNGQAEHTRPAEGVPIMAPNQDLPLLTRCWRRLTALVPERIRARLRGPVKGALARVFRRSDAARAAELCLQLEAILRELRRLHVQLEELRQECDGRAPRHGDGREAA